MAGLHPFDPKINQPRPNADGSVSTELTRTVQFPDGTWANVPSLWWGDGANYQDFGNLDDDAIAGMAVEYEKTSGRAFPRYRELDEAEKEAQARSSGGGGEQGAITAPSGLTLEQRKALAVASARLRAQQGGNAPIALDGMTAAPLQAPAPPTTGSLRDQLMEGYVPLNRDAPFPGLGDFSTAFTSGMAQGATLGFADEILAGAAAPFTAIGPAVAGKGYDVGRQFNTELEYVRNKMAEEQAASPSGALAGDVLGSLATGGALAKGGVTLMNGAKSLPGLIGRGAVEGAAYGGVSGFGRSDAADLAGRASDAGKGATFGAASGGLLSGAGGLLAGRAAKAAVPTVDDLKNQARALYDKADASGVTFPRGEVKRVADDIAAKAISEGIDPALHPRATAALKRLVEAANAGLTVRNAQTMRRVIAAAGKDPMNPDEGRIAGQMLDKFDDMVAAKAPELAHAREIYHQAKKGELIEQTIELAGIRAGQYGNGGMENALRTEFRGLARKIAKGQLKGLSKEEVEAINKVANGGPMENILRWVGKAAPTGIVSAGLGSGVPFAIGSAIGGPGLGAAAAGATMGAGILGRTVAGGMTGANAARAAMLARNGGVSTAPSLSPGQAAALDALVGASGNEAAALPKRVPIEILVTGGNHALAP